MTVVEADRKPNESRAGRGPAGGVDTRPRREDVDPAQLRRQLEESEARFRNIIQRTTDGIMVLGSDGRVRFVNPAAEVLFGRKGPDLLEREFGFPIVVGETAELDIVRPGDSEPLVAELRTAETQWDGEPAQLLSLRDITDRKKSEERARHLLLEQAARKQAEEADRRSRFLSEASAALDSSLDLDGTLAELARLLVPRVADWCIIELMENDGARTVAVAHADAERQDTLDQVKNLAQSAGPAPLFAAEDATMHNALQAARLGELTHDNARARLLAEIGTRSLIIVPLHAREDVLGTLTVGGSERDFTADDLELMREVATRARRAIENAQLYRAALVASQAKTDFLGIVSHELRTPLHAIMGYTEMMLSGVYGPVQEQHGEKLRRIDSCAHHLLQLIEEILAYARLEGGRDEARPQRFQLGELIDGVVSIAEPLVRAKGLDFNLEVSDPRAPCVTDVGKLRQIALNLLSNAVNFTAQGSVGLRAGIADDDIVIAVSDTGIGIVPAHIEAIFEPFWQVEQPLRRHTGGTGLGLSVSRRLVEMLGGTIEVDSTVGAGSTFTVRLPARYAA